MLTASQAVFLPPNQSRFSHQAGLILANTQNSPSPPQNTMKSAGCEEAQFLEACSLCRKPLGQNSDIFMYRGNNPFCSQECRQEQIEIDEARERRRWKRSTARQGNENSNKSNPTTNKAVQTGTVAVA